MTPRSTITAWTKPVWEEIANGHFVYGNQRELEGYRKEYESQL